MLSYDHENIVALATPPGKGALAIVRLSGPDLCSIYRAFSRKDPVDRRAVFSKIYHPRNNKLLDEAIITYFKSPNSFTGEDVVEITCHGGAVVSRSIILAALDSGVRNANPGEFSFRAFINGKIDLLQAEAVASLISSKSQFSAHVSLQHLTGRVSNVFSEIKGLSLDVLSIIEKELDFSEEELDLTSYNIIRNMVVDIQKRLKVILNDTTFGKNALLGIRVVLLGKPNSGKSSLFNAILGFDRAIVSNAPGTTRDTIESSMELGGVSVCFIDTAGLWESDEFLDKLGVEKTIDSIARANLCLLIDENSPSDLLKSSLSHKIKDPFVLVKSKCDLDDSILNNDKNIFYISAKNGQGIERLLTYISTYITENVNCPEALNHILVAKRQRDLLMTALSSVAVVIKQIDAGIDTDILASGLHGFVAILKEVVGEIPNRDVLNNIFSNFCVGK